MIHKSDKGFTKEDTLIVKGIAVVLLIFHHLFRTVDRIAAYGVVPKLLDPEWIACLATDARICVWIFAFLSAYGLSIKYVKVREHCSYAEFVYRQWLSLMKPFWFIYVVVFISSFFVFKNPQQVYENNLLCIIPDFFGLADIFELPMLSSVWWYMCFAQVLVVTIPFWVYLVERTGILSMVIVFIFLRFFGTGFSSTFGGSYTQYLYAVIMACYFSQNDLFRVYEEKLNGSRRWGAGILPLATALCCAHLKVWISGTVFKSTATMFSAVSCVALCLYVQNYIRAPLLRKVFLFLGQHSGNIFMIHALIFVFYPQIVYGSKDVVISTITLLIISLLISVLMEFIKKIIRYDQIITCFFQKIESVALKNNTTVPLSKR